MVKRCINTGNPLMCILYVYDYIYKPATRKIIESKDDFVIGRCIKFPNTQTKIISNSIIIIRFSYNVIVQPSEEIVQYDITYNVTYKALVEVKR